MCECLVLLCLSCPSLPHCMCAYELVSKFEMGPARNAARRRRKTCVCVMCVCMRTCVRACVCVCCVRSQSYCIANRNGSLCVSHNQPSSVTLCMPNSPPRDQLVRFHNSKREFGLTGSSGSKEPGPRAMAQASLQSVAAFLLGPALILLLHMPWGVAQLILGVPVIESYRRIWSATSPE